MKQVIELLVIGEIVLLALFSLMWVIQLKTKNAGIVDVVWSASFPLLGLIYFINVDGYLPRQLLVIATVAIWGLRLASYLFIRTVGHGEDIRYTTLRKSWGEKQNIKMLRFFIFQAILAVALSLPFAQIMVNSDPGITRTLSGFAGAVSQPLAALRSRRCGSMGAGRDGSRLDA